MPLDTDFIRFSREMKPTEQCKISQKNTVRPKGGGRTTAPPKYATAIYIYGSSMKQPSNHVVGKVVLERLECYDGRTIAYTYNITTVTAKLKK